MYRHYSTARRCKRLERVVTISQIVINVLLGSVFLYAIVEELSSFAKWMGATVALIKPLYMMIVSVENHSPTTIYLSKVVLELDEGEVFFVKRDLLTDILNSRRALNSGARFEFSHTRKPVCELSR
jgi:hypothetical protein